ncbi:HNH endonuclease family protein [Streptococcus pyogenes]|nr:HNH endonuclease [Streptococcus pyogenes]WSE65480.1 HNH endonuclease [Streptococcus pyogenes]VGU55737.1 HNH endonuclease family protein [Streptococcus pyogenes]HEP1411118.1 HNH endonuclease [Streptococcus pyogenes]HES8531805.1 HNH endonuclease [Streptococcus pyogenes]
MAQLRADKKGTHRVAFDRNKKKLLKVATVCGICGKPVDKSLKYPHPLSAAIDHIVPIAKGGHPSALENLQLTHWQCNRQKSDKLFANQASNEPKTIGNRNLPQSRDWSSFAFKKNILIYAKSS